MKNAAKARCDGAGDECLSGVHEHSYSNGRIARALYQRLHADSTRVRGDWGWQGSHPAKNGVGRPPGSATLGKSPSTADHRQRLRTGRDWRLRAEIAFSILRY